MSTVASSKVCNRWRTMVLFQVCQCPLHQLWLDALVLGCLLQQLDAGLQAFTAAGLVGSNGLNLSSCGAPVAAGAAAGGWVRALNLLVGLSTGLVDVREASLAQSAFRPCERTAVPVHATQANWQCNHGASIHQGSRPALAPPPPAHGVHCWGINTAHLLKGCQSGYTAKESYSSVMYV